MSWRQQSKSSHREAFSTVLLMLVSKSRNIVIISRKNDREIVGLSKTSVSKGINLVYWPSSI